MEIESAFQRSLRTDQIKERERELCISIEEEKAAKEVLHQKRLNDLMN